MCKLTRQAQDAGLAKMKPGTTVGELGKAIRKKAEEVGLEIHGGRFGHGIGLDYSEWPSLSEDNRQMFELGTTAVVHSIFSVPGAEGRICVPLGDICCVTKSGPEFLASFPRTPFVAGR